MIEAERAERGRTSPADPGKGGIVVQIPVSTRRGHRLLVVAFLALLASQARTATAWDPETHVSIVKTAFALSPAAQARVPGEYREEFFAEVASPDTFDSLCRYHNGPSARVDPCAEAQKVLTSLSAPGPARSAYARTKSLGRLLHFVADAAVPTPIREGKAYTILDFFTRQDFVVVRQPQALSLPLAASLRQAGALAQWPDESPAAHSFVFRRAVNLVVDVLLLLPPGGDGRSLPDDGPVIFLLDRLRNLKGGANTETHYVTTYNYGGGYGGYGHVEASHSVREVRTGGDTNRVDDLMTRRTFQIVESAARREENGSTVAVLLFNNSETCQTDISLRFKSFAAPIEGSVPAGALRAATVRLPQGVPAAALELFSATASCGAGRAEPGAIPTDRRIVLGLSGFEREIGTTKSEERVRLDPGKPVSSLGTSPHVRINRSALEGINDGPSLANLPATIEPSVIKGLAGSLLLERLTVDASRNPWLCRLVVRNTGETPLEGLDFTLAATPRDSDLPSTREKVQFNARSVAPGSTQELFALLTPVTKLPPAALSVTAVSRSSLPAERPVPVQNTVPRSVPGKE